MEDIKISKAKVKKSEVKKEISKPKLSSDIVKVKNFTNRKIYVSTGIIEPGKTGECTRAEANSYHKALKVL